jgi:hypothetical protein
MSHLWHLEFIGFTLIECEPHEQALFTDVNGTRWRKGGRTLVQPDNPDERGRHTIIYREDTVLLLTGPMALD